MGVLDLMSRERRKAKEDGEFTLDLGELEEVEDGEVEDVDGSALQKLGRATSNGIPFSTSRGIRKHADLRQRLLDHRSPVSPHRESCTRHVGS
jgi:hypothetical protein